MTSRDVWQRDEIRQGFLRSPVEWIGPDKSGTTNENGANVAGPRRREFRKNLSFCRVVVLVDLSPIDHVPPCLEVVRPAVLVLEIICVFPDVAPQDRFDPVHQ